MPTQEQWVEAVDALAWFCFRGSVHLDRHPEQVRLRRIGGAIYQKLSMAQTKRDEIARLVDWTFECIDGPPPCPDNAPALGGSDT